VVNGRLQCLGSAQHLKLRFGDGFEVNVKTSLPTHDDLIVAVTSLVRRNLLQIEVGANADVSLLTSSHLEATRISKSQVLSLLGSLNLINLESYSMEAVELLTLIDAEEGFISLKAVLEWAWAEKAARLLNLFMRKLSQGDTITWSKGKARSASSPRVSPREEGEMSAKSSASTVAGSAGSFKLLERSTAHSFRYRLQVNMALLASLHSSSASSVNSISALAYIFRCFEANKNTIRVQEYSVGQTTLEQIFNQFAASQDNPEVAAIQSSGELDSGRRSGSFSMVGNRQRRTSSADYVDVNEEQQSFL
jgi:hypothetical protein